MFGIEFGDLFFRLVTSDGVDMELTRLKDDIQEYNKWLHHIVTIPPCTENFQV